MTSPKVGSEIWNREESSGLVFEAGDKPAKVFICDAREPCRYSDGCKCTCYHVHDEALKFECFVMDKSVSCKEHGKK